MTSHPLLLTTHHCFYVMAQSLFMTSYILYIIYDVTPTVCMTNPALYLTRNTLKLTSLPLHMSSHILFWRHHTYSVRYHWCHMYAINGLYRTWYPHFMTTFTINDITCTVFIPWQTLYMTSHLLCMMSHSLFVTSHNDPIYGIKHYMFMLYSLDMASGTVLWPQNHCVPSQPLCLT